MNDDCVLTTPAMTQGLERLQVYCRDLGLEAQILPPNELWALPVLAAAVPSGRGLLLTLSWLSVPAEEAQLSRFLQFYEEFPLPEDMETPGAETMADLNRRTPLGCPSSSGCIVQLPRGVRRFRSAMVSALGESISSGRGNSS